MGPDREWIMATVERYERPLLGYVQRLLGDADRARDVVQDAFLALCRQRRADLESRVGPWLFAVSRRRAIDILRKEQRMIATSPDELLAPPARGPEPALMAEIRDATRLVLAHLADLPPSEHEAVRLRFQQQFSYREIAQVMGLTESHVGVLLHNGLKRLRQRMPQLA